MIRGRILAFALSMVVVAADAGTAAGDRPDSPLPVPYTMEQLRGPDTAPPGANLPHCNSRHRPVVFVNGMNFVQSVLWSTGAPYLHNAGLCVFTFNDGDPTMHGQSFQQINDIRQAGRLLATEVDMVLAQTGATKVDLVADSMGGMVAAYYLNVLGGYPKVDKSVGITPANHGTTLGGLYAALDAAGPILAMLGRLVPSFAQLRLGSELNSEIYSGGGDTRPGVIYTVLATRYDEIVTPPENGFLSGPKVSNIWLQDGCVADHSNHMTTAPHSPRVWRYVLNALDPAAAIPVPCIPIG